MGNRYVVRDGGFVSFIDGINSAPAGRCGHLRLQRPSGSSEDRREEPRSVLLRGEPQRHGESGQSLCALCTHTHTF